MAERINKMGEVVTIPDIQFHCFSRPDLVFGFDDEGMLVHNTLEPFEERASSSRVAYEFELDLGQLNVVLPFGLTVISGPTKIGKSRFLRALATSGQIDIFNACESYDAPEDVLSTIAYRDADTALAAAVRTVMTGSQKIIAIDSLRAPLFETSGAAGSKGIIMPFFTNLTRVSNSLAAAGVTALATINPMHEAEDYQSLFLQMLAASTAGAIMLEKSSEHDFIGTIETRDRFSGALNRAPRKFRLGQMAKPAAPPTEVFLQPAVPVIMYGGVTSTMINKLQGVI